MPIRVEKYAPRVENIRRRRNLYKYNQVRRENYTNDAEHLINDYKIGLLGKCVFRMLDKMNPIILKHHKIGKKVMMVSENLLKYSHTISK